MLLKKLFSICIAGMLLIVVTAHEDEDDKNLAYDLKICCWDGKEHVVNNCEMNPKFYDTESCYKSALKCCSEENKRQKDCNAGMKFAQINQQCTGLIEEIKKCCEDCIIGIRSGSSKCEYATETSNACCKYMKEKTTTEPPLTEEQDECQLRGNKLCNHKCVPLNSTFVCQCTEGYELLNDTFSCRPLKSCKINNPCSQVCTEKKGEVSCSCQEGFDLQSDNTTCSDTDECISDTYKCGDDKMCTNTIGSYKCDCKNGFTEDPKTKNCTDIDDCKMDTYKCDNKQICQNTIGSYICVCDKGYFLDNKTNLCEDKDECSKGEHNCTLTQKCVNLNGSYECECLHGYKKDPSTNLCYSFFKSLMRWFQEKKIIDGVECDNPGICGPDMICRNFTGEYECTCASGYKLNEINNLCERSTIDCGSLNCAYQCVKTNIGFACECPRGYTIYNRSFCNDTNECEQLPNACPNKICINVAGGFNCISCPKLYMLQGSKCVCETCTKRYFLYYVVIINHLTFASPEKPYQLIDIPKLNQDKKGKFYHILKYSEFFKFNELNQSYVVNLIKPAVNIKHPGKVFINVNKNNYTESHQIYFSISKYGF